MDGHSSKQAPSLPSAMWYVRCCIAVGVVAISFNAAKCHLSRFSLCGPASSDMAGPQAHDHNEANNSLIRIHAKVV